MFNSIWYILTFCLSPIVLVPMKKEQKLNAVNLVNFEDILCHLDQMKGVIC